MAATLNRLVRDGKVSLPCGDYVVLESDRTGLIVKGKRGGKVALTIVLAGVSGRPDAVGFVAHTYAGRHLGNFALAADGTVEECV